MASWQAWIFSLLELALTVLVSLYARDYPFALLTWAFAAFVFEFSQIWGRHTTRSTGGFWGLLLSYFHQDSFNVLDIGALAVTNAALGYACYEKFGGSVGIVDPMTALSILLLWIRQLRLLTLTSNVMTPLVLMLVNMLRDVVQFLLLLSILLLAFAFSMKQLFQEVAQQTQESGYQSECYDTTQKLGRTWSALVLLFELSLSGEVQEPFQCMR